MSAVSPFHSIPIDASGLRRQFPILSTSNGGKPLTYLDNGATTQKPRVVIDAIRHYYEAENANIHRGVYHLSQLATEKYEDARRKVKQFLNAADDREIIFTRGTTEAINLVAHSFAAAFIRPGDEILVSTIEHHANIVPWQLAAQTYGATVRPIPVNDSGELLLDEFEQMLVGGKVKIVAVTHLSNSLGTINDVSRIIQLSHARDAKVLIDGAQWVAHYPTDVRALDADFYAFSGHKIYGPTGIGVLYGKRSLLESMPPYQSGGDMILSVSFEKTLFADLPNKFEAGTPDIAGAVGLGAAIDFLTDIGMGKVAKHEDELGQYLNEQVGAIDGIRVIGTAKRKGGICSFVIEDPPISAHDAGVLLDLENIAVRTGHHCCQPTMDRMHVSATIRASIALYNTPADVDVLVGALQKIIEQEQKTEHLSAESSAEIQYPTRVAVSVSAVADELAETFEFLGDRDARTQYLLDLADKIPPMPTELKTESTRVHGCMSIVHLFGQSTGDGELQFIADSDAHIVRGLIGLLEKLFSGQPAHEVLDFDIENFLHRIHLEQFISTQRRNGLAGMIKKIRELAKRVQVQA
ncbi:MAG: SufS family cysteine desulfurase [Phycisphaerae bacterium]|nr:SufS family cysteine desulfurase [Phycisphaerae bacterium]